MTDWRPFDPTGAGPKFQKWNSTPDDMGPYGAQLRSDKTKICYISPDGQRVYWLGGDWAGNRGVTLAPGISGILGPQFTQVYTSGPWMRGEEHERTDYGKRVIQLGLHFGPYLNAVSRLRYRANTHFNLRALEEQWWQDWPEHHLEPMGFWGEFTRYSGWRWTRVRIGEAGDDRVDLDPQAFGNNSYSRSMTIHAPFPFYSKRPLTKEWKNSPDNALINGKNHGILRLPNRGDYAQAPQFIIEGAGDVTIQDGITDRMVPIPTISPRDGMILVNTDRSARTLTSEHDPIDTPFYQLIRNSNVLDWILGDITQANSGLPIGRRMPGGVDFGSEIPPRTMAVIKVTHSNPNGKITMILPQWYRRGVS